MPPRPAGQQNAPSAEVAWTVPDPWQRVETDQRMRLATFHAQTGDDTPVQIAVTAFPGQVGTLLGNINRWRRQLGLDPVQQPPEPVADFHAGGLHSRVFQITAQNSDQPAQRTVVAILHSHSNNQGKTWFIKMTDTPQRTDAQRDNFIAFAKSFTLENTKDGATP